jgi:hypothetical protein
MVQESEAMDDELLRALAEASDEAGVNLASALYPTVSSPFLLINALIGWEKRGTRIPYPTLAKRIIHL